MAIERGDIDAICEDDLQELVIAEENPRHETGG